MQKRDLGRKPSEKDGNEKKHSVRKLYKQWRVHKATGAS